MNNNSNQMVANYAMQHILNVADQQLQNNTNQPFVFIINNPLEGFYTIKDVMEILHCGKKTAQKLFNMKEFPACDFGKEKVVSKQAFYDFFATRRSKEDYVYWIN